MPQLTVNPGRDGSVYRLLQRFQRDMLTYAAMSPNPGVATASIADTAITVGAMVPGNAPVMREWGPDTGRVSAARIPIKVVDRNGNVVRVIPPR